MTAEVRHRLVFGLIHGESNPVHPGYGHDILSNRLCAHRQKFEPVHMLKSLTHPVAIYIVNLLEGSDLAAQTRVFCATLVGTSKVFIASMIPLVCLQHTS